ncbi:hypothetical protein JCM6882_001578 [Rhodosporidiobolus microsporus]
MPQPLPYELLVLQHEALELAEASFALPGELLLADQTAAFLPTLRTWLEAGGGDSVELTKGPEWTDELAFHLHLTLEPPSSSSLTPLPLVISVKIPLVHLDDARGTTPEGAPWASIAVQQPPWLPRAAYDSLAASLPSVDPSDSFSSNAELLLSTVEHVREEATNLIPNEPESGEGKEEKPEEEEFRVWMWFPSLSTREKRDDIVNWAGDYGLSGFVLAGKPALLCVEGTEANVQEYLAEIKSKSWADIPSFQKKISERYRTPLLPSSVPKSATEDPTSRRIFTGMDEITSLISRGGFRGNRGEMGEVRDYLASKGLGEIFGVVIGGGQFA